MLFLCSWQAFGQSNIDKLLKEYNTRSIPYISVEELHKSLDNYIILDTRKKEEYEVSHIPGAFWVGEECSEELLLKRLKEKWPGKTYLWEEKYTKLDKQAKIVVYCSVGIRSEDYGEELKALGFTNIQNLYGSIFTWKDAGYEVLNTLEKPTDSVHVFSKVWGKYLKTGNKVF